MSSEPDIDVLVIGAGPAGLCAGLRLQQLGYRIAMVERACMPRPNIGESLTPGVRNILELLDAAAAVAEVPVLTALPTRLLWSGPEPESVPPAASAGAVMIDRGAFDHALFQLLEKRGARCMAAAETGAIAGKPGAWTVQVRHGGGPTEMSARLILDARGRSTLNGTRRFALAPSLLALWAEIPGRDAPHEVQVEALEDGWIWGSPLPCGAYRVMSFCDPLAMRQSTRGKPEKWLRASMAHSRLFPALAERSFNDPVQACAATPYLDEQAWSPGCIKLGDAAFAIDPLSSSGVEKAMRFSLQAAVAVHTMLSDSTAVSLAQDFFQGRLLDCVARHSIWTRRYYGQAWPGLAHAFWRDRTEEFQPDAGSYNPVMEKVRQAMRAIGAQETVQPVPTDAAALNDPASLAAMLNRSVAFSPQLAFLDLPCVVEDKVQVRQAISHPNLDRPVAYVEGQEIALLLQVVPCVGNLSTAIELWAYRMPLHKARRIAGWLCQKGVLQLA